MTFTKDTEEAPLQDNSNGYVKGCSPLIIAKPGNLGYKRCTLLMFSYQYDIPDGRIIFLKCRL